MRYLLLFYIIFFNNICAKTIALFDHQVSLNAKLTHKIINYNNAIASTNSHSNNLLCNLKGQINLYLYPFLEFKKDNDYYFTSLKEAIKNRVDYIWIPSSSEVYSDKELALLKIAERMDIVIITSAGNESLDLSINKRYPCSYNLSNIRCIQTKEPYSNKMNSAITIDNSSIPNCNGTVGKGTSQATVLYLNRLLNLK